MKKYVALFSITLLVMAAMLYADPSITGATILKNRCDHDPDYIVIFGSNDNYVYALDAESDCIVWKTEVDDDVKAELAIDNQKLYFGTVGYTFYALDIEDGNIEWERDADGQIYGAFAVDNDYVYTADTNGEVQLLNPSSGSNIFTYNTNNVKQDVVLNDNVLYFVDDFLKDGTLYALNLETLKIDWDFKFDTQVLAAPLVTNDAVYVPSNSNALYKISKQGHTQWIFNTNKAIKSTPILDDGILYFGGTDGTFYAINDEDGSVVWEYYAGSDITAQATSNEDMVYFGVYSNKVYALDKNNGEVVWTFQTDGRTYAGLTLFEDTLFVPSGDHFFYALDANTGEKKWDYETRGALYGKATVVSMNGDPIDEPEEDDSEDEQESDEEDANEEDEQESSDDEEGTEGEPNEDIQEDELDDEETTNNIEEESEPEEDTSLEAEEEEELNFFQKILNFFSL